MSDEEEEEEEEENDNDYDDDDDENYYNDTSIVTSFVAKTADRVLSTEEVINISNYKRLINVLSTTLWKMMTSERHQVKKFDTDR